MRFPLADGTRVDRELTSSHFEWAVAMELYGTYGRMMLTRALTAAAHGDLVPLLRLAYLEAGLNPQTLKPIIAPTYSNAIDHGVDCRDYHYYDGTQQQRSDAFVASFERLAAQLPRIGGGVSTAGYHCIWWPGEQPPSTRPTALTNPGIPTFVIVATADPATPASQGRAVYSRLDDGYLITAQGGAHVVSGHGIACLDNLILNFLETGKRPVRRTTLCPHPILPPPCNWVRTPCPMPCSSRPWPASRTGHFASCASGWVRVMR